MTAFEDFVNAELPRRVAVLTPAMCSGYDGDPNDVAAPDILDNAPVGTHYFWENTSTFYIKMSPGVGNWQALANAGDVNPEPNTFYVNQVTGSDSNNGSYYEPLQTATEAVTRIVAAAAIDPTAHYVMHLAPGDYIAEGQLDFASPDIQYLSIIGVPSATKAGYALWGQDIEEKEVKLNTIVLPTNSSLKKVIISDLYATMVEDNGSPGVLNLEDGLHIIDCVTGNNGIRAYRAHKVFIERCHVSTPDLEDVIAAYINDCIIPDFVWLNQNTSKATIPALDVPSLDLWISNTEIWSDVYSQKSVDLGATPSVIVHMNSGAVAHGYLEARNSFCEIHMGPGSYAEDINNTVAATGTIRMQGGELGPTAATRHGDYLTISWEDNNPEPNVFNVNDVYGNNLFNGTEKYPIRTVTEAFERIKGLTQARIVILNQDHYENTDVKFTTDHFTLERLTITSPFVPFYNMSPDDIWNGYVSLPYIRNLRADESPLLHDSINNLKYLEISGVHILDVELTTKNIDILSPNYFGSEGIHIHDCYIQNLMLGSFGYLYMNNMSSYWTYVTDYVEARATNCHIGEMSTGRNGWALPVNTSHHVDYADLSTDYFYNCQFWYMDKFDGWNAGPGYEGQHIITHLYDTNVMEELAINYTDRGYTLPTEYHLHNGSQVGLVVSIPFARPQSKIIFDGGAIVDRSSVIGAISDSAITTSFGSQFINLEYGDEADGYTGINLWVNKYVGNDIFNGSREYPFRTVQAALDAIEATTAKTGIVNVAPGDYFADGTITVGNIYKLKIVGEGDIQKVIDGDSDYTNNIGYASLGSIQDSQLTQDLEYCELQNIFCNQISFYNSTGYSTPDPLITRNFTVGFFAKNCYLHSMIVGAGWRMVVENCYILDQWMPESLNRAEIRNSYVGNWFDIGFDSFVDAVRSVKSDGQFLYYIDNCITAGDTELNTYYNGSTLLSPNPIIYVDKTKIDIASSHDVQPVTYVLGTGTVVQRFINVSGDIVEFDGGTYAGRDTFPLSLPTVEFGPNEYNPEPGVFYVNQTSGNDLFNGSKKYPVKTIQAAINAATAGLDQVILIGPGSYNEQLALNKNQVHLKGAIAPGQYFVGGNFVDVDTPKIWFNHVADGATLTLSANDNIIENLQIEASTSVAALSTRAVDATAGPEVLFRNCNIRHAGGGGAQTEIYGVKQNFASIEYENTSVMAEGTATTKYAANGSGSVSFKGGACHMNSLYGDSGTIEFAGGVALIDHIEGAINTTQYEYSGGRLVFNTYTGDNPMHSKTNFVTMALTPGNKVGTPHSAGLSPFYKLWLESLTDDPSDAADGQSWYRSDEDQFKGRRDGTTKNFLMTGDAASGITSNILTVDPSGSANYTTIQAAIDACDGVTPTLIQIAPGTYVEKLVLKDMVTLEGTTGALFLGYGAPSDPFKPTTISYTHSSNGSTVTIPFTAQTAKLKNLHIRTDCITNPGLDIEGLTVYADYPEIENVTIYNLNTSGLIQNSSIGIHIIGADWGYLEVFGFCSTRVESTNIITSIGLKLDVNAAISLETDVLIALAQTYALYADTNAYVYIYDGSMRAGNAYISDTVQFHVYGTGGYIFDGDITGGWINDSLHVNATSSTISSSGYVEQFKLNLRQLASTPGDSDDGDIWYNSNTGHFVGERGGSVKNLLMDGDIAGGTTIENTDIDTGTEDVDTFADTLGSAAIWEYSVVNGAGDASRSGTLYVTWLATPNTISDLTEEIKCSIGDTDDLTFSVDINTDNVRLRATVSTDNWVVRAQRRVIL